MTPAALIAALQARGVTLEPRGDHLAIRPPSLVSPAELEVLRRFKRDVLALLLAPTPTPPEPLDRILGMTLQQFEQEGTILEARVPWLAVTLWMVPTHRDVAQLVAEGVSRGRIWTAGELLNLMAIGGRSPEDLQTLTHVKIEFDAEIVETRARASQ